MAQFKDIASNTDVCVSIKENRGAKIYLDNNGNLLSAYINGELKVGNLRIVPNGDMCIIKKGKSWKCKFSRKEKDYFYIGTGKVTTKSYELFEEFII